MYPVFLPPQLLHRVGKQTIRRKQVSRVILNGGMHYEEKPSKVREERVNEWVGMVEESP